MASNPYSTAPLPPPPGGAGTPAALHNTAVSHIAGNATSPVNQMSNGFGGRVGGNPNQSVRPVVSGGNRTSQHVATPGNNNVSYASPSLLNSANSLWQAAMNKPGSPGPANAMSYGFIKNTADRKPPLLKFNSLTVPNMGGAADGLTDEQKALLPPGPLNPGTTTKKDNASGGLATVGPNVPPPVPVNPGPLATVGPNTPAPLSTSEYASQIRAKITSGGGVEVGKYLPGLTGGTQMVTGLKKYGNIYLPLVGTGSNQQVHWAYRSLM